MSVDTSPSSMPSSRALSTRRMIFPLRVFGSVAVKTILYDGNGPELVPHVLFKLVDELRSLGGSLFEDNKRLYNLPSDRVGFADHGCLRHRRVARNR